MNIYPYLNFDGQAEEAMTFYQSILGGEFEGGISYFGEAPGMEIPEEEKMRVMHISLKLSEGLKIMASDTSPSMGHVWIKGNHNYISINADSKAEGVRIFSGLAEGGKVEMDYQKTFWGAYFGSFEDKFGIGWMVNYDLQGGEE
ncbi:PhnB protein [Algoriphagus alkaliphilus]|uniref:PhnB protein n=1 Tax=Algoriphagus alkaliphilus TaxID=279824 RepID=A0A1G5Y1J2_9BACT|nr:VOC family protein [Algoriphagus alkaliphilus]MBA4302552.1 VOC family protein [Cyclobacterium sp.]SDA76086.1 PhnB protein [Algoriphagus alkaliphilus]